MPVTTKLGRLVTYLEEFLPMNLCDPLTDYHNAFDFQTWYVGYLP